MSCVAGRGYFPFRLEFGKIADTGVRVRNASEHTRAFEKARSLQTNPLGEHMTYKLRRRDATSIFARTLASAGYCVAMLVLLAGHGVAIACQGVRLPFVGNASHARSHQVFVESAGGNSTYCVTIDGQSVQLGSTIPLHVLRAPKGQRLIVGREKIVGHLSISIGRSPAMQPLSLPYDDRAQLWPHHAFNVGERAFLLVYDVSANVPSGRRMSRGPERNELYEIVDEPAALKKVAEMPGGIDQAILEVPFRGGRLLCGQAACLAVDASAMSRRINLPAGKQILELASDGERVWGLFQVDYDDRVRPAPKPDEPFFFVCEIETTSCTDVPPSTIAYDLRVARGSPNYRTASTALDFAKILRFDLERQRGNGIAEYAVPNSEGRVAWGLAYYGNGLVTLSNVSMPKEFDELSREARERLGAELRSLTELALTRFPGLSVKRYSLNREPVMSLLHTARAARLLERGRAVFTSERVELALQQLRRSLTTGSGTLETLDGETLRFERYAPIWADGVPVPWNYQSGWVEAIAMLGALNANPSLRTRAAAMITRFAKIEKLAEAPVTWHYAAGPARDGWDGQISVNTPRWTGDKGSAALAHISYRTMDVMALLAAADAGIAIQPDMRKHVIGLIAEGHIYPFACENIKSRECVLPKHVARRYARAALPWQVQNQVWALRSLAAETYP